MKTIRNKYLTDALCACAILAASCVIRSGPWAPPGAGSGHVDTGSTFSQSPALPDHQILESFFIGEFTAYNPTREQTDDTPLIMASGKKVYDGAVACPGDYDFGTLIEIEGLGIFTCEDRMARRFRDSNYFDILMFDRTAALKFGRRTLRYKVLDSGPGEVEARS